MPPAAPPQINPMPLGYQGPQMVPNYAPPGVITSAPCPACGCPYASKISFTWWGGVLGPRIFNHVKCNQCKTTFNSKTGKSNNTAIAIYLSVSFVVAIVVVAMVAMRGS
jgi:hypothetical protein